MPPRCCRQDDESDGFNNVADVLQVSPAFVDAYISAARQVAVEALGDPQRQAGGRAVRASDPGVAGNQEFHVDGLPLGTRGGTAVVYNFPADGTYELSHRQSRHRAVGDQPGVQEPL